MDCAARTLLLGIGNTLLTDDGVGVHVITALRENLELPPDTIIHDGGTIGLALLADVEDCQELIAVDAMELGEAPGALRVFSGGEMDKTLSGKKRTAHEVALSDLLQAAALIGRKPARRALIGIQPESTAWGLQPTPGVSAAIPAACDVITTLLAEWHNGSP